MEILAKPSRGNVAIQSTWHHGPVNTGNRSVTAVTGGSNKTLRDSGRPYATHDGYPELWLGSSKNV